MKDWYEFIVVMCCVVLGWMLVMAAFEIGVLHGLILGAAG